MPWDVVAEELRAMFTRVPVAVTRQLPRFHFSASEELTIAGMTFTTFDLGGHEQGKSRRRRMRRISPSL